MGGIVFFLNKVVNWVFIYCFILGGNSQASSSAAHSSVAEGSGLGGITVRNPLIINALNSSTVVNK